MQTNAANMDPEISKMHYVKMAELWKLDDLAESVSKYQPQPNPQQQELMALQIEEQKLKNALAQKQLEDYDSKIFERLSRTDENANGDAMLKRAKAEMSLAAAEKIKSETDVLDASFLKLQSGQQRVEDVEDQQFKADVELAKEDKKSALQMAREQFNRASLNAPSKVINEI